MDLPRVVFEGHLDYDNIPTRVGIAPVLPVCMVWEQRWEVYLSDDRPRELYALLLCRIAERAAQVGLPVHYWLVRGATLSMEL